MDSTHSIAQKPMDAHQEIEKPRYQNIIAPGRRNFWAQMKELKLYKELFYALAMQSISVRYKQTVVGILWAVLQPILTMIILTLVFGYLAKMGTDNSKYPLIVLAGILPWQLFATGVNLSTNSLVGNSALITKIYFPRIIIPTSACLVGLVDFLLAFGVFILMGLFFGVYPSWKYIFVPCFIAICFLSSLGIGLFLGGLNVRYRDIKHIVPFMIQIGIYISPVGFTSDKIPEKWAMVYALNPIVSAIDGLRWALVDGKAPDLNCLLVSTAIAIFLFTLGVITFRRNERSFADYI